MAGNYQNTQVTVGTSPTLIAVVPAVQNVIVYAAATGVFIGGPNVTATTGVNQGIPLAATTLTTIPGGTSQDNALYGVATSAPTAVNIFYPSSVF